MEPTAFGVIAADIVMKIGHRGGSGGAGLGGRTEGAQRIIPAADRNMRSGNLVDVRRKRDEPAPMPNGVAV